MTPSRGESNASFRARSGILLVCTLVFIQICGPSLAGAPEWPVVHLRTGSIHTQTAARGLFASSSTSTRRRLLEEQEQRHPCHTAHPAWGRLAAAHQALVTHAPGLGHDDRHALLDHVESAGAAVMGYLPEHTWLVVGPPTALAAAADHPSVLWAGPAEAAHKVAPEWADLLPGIAAAAGLAESAAGNGTAAAAAALEGLPVRLKRLPGRLPLVGIRVVFPTAHGPAPQAEGHPGTAAAAARARRVLAERAGCHAGAATTAEWAPLLRARFGSSIEVLPAGRASAVVLAPPGAVAAAVEWLSQRPAVRWVAPLPRTSPRNRQASSIIQSAKPVPTAAKGNTDVDPSYHPVWAAGIQGQGQVIGQGDSGLDYNHCFFKDPAVNWAAGISVVDRVRTFQSTEHRKIRLYRGFADFSDSNGHGTHTAGTLAGIPYGTALGDDSAINVGMAPAAKIAFIDLSSAADGDAILTPYNLVDDYFPYTTAVGAAVHSDSWGSTSITYDSEAAQVDEYCWANPTFLPVFPAGNDGDRSTQQGFSGDTTVNSPATAKNCIAAGATQTAGERADQGLFADKVWQARAQLGPALPLDFRVLQSDFSASFSTLGARPYPLVAAEPLEACTALTNPGALAGGVALIQRGTCTYVEKAAAAAAAGAAAALVFDNEVGAYFVATSSAGAPAAGLIPTATMPRRLGQNLIAVLATGRPVNVSFSADSPPQYGFENLALFSSQGPVGRDRRVKPDLVAPGTLTSADASSPDQCGVATFGGTSMATPVIAGAATLVRQYFLDGYFPTGVAAAADGFDPSSALVKAVLVAGAATITGFEADTGLPIDPTPSYRQGFGRVFLGASLFLKDSAFSPARLALQDAVPIATDEVHQFCITAGGGPLSVTLVWTDYPGDPGAARSLVNDLDLVVRSEGLNGRSLLGNGGDVEDSARPDASNNIEQVTLEAFPPGRVAIEVRGTSVAPFAGPQPYAIVVNGDFSGTLARPGGGGAGAAECAVVVATIVSGPSGVTNAGVVQFELGTTAGSASGVDFECRMADARGGVGAPGTADWAPCSSPAAYKDLPDGAYTFSARAAGETIDASSTFTKDTAPPVVGLAADVPAATSAATATMTFSANDTTAATFSCRVSVEDEDGAQGGVVAGSRRAAPVTLGAPFNCTSPQTVAWLLPGKWTFAVEAADAAGNAAAPVLASWTVGLDPGVAHVRLTSGPLLTVPKEDIAFKFTVLGGAGAGAATECGLAAGPGAPPAQWQPCAGGVSYGQPDDGTYTFAARVVGDAAAPAPGALPATWAVSIFTVDSTPPTVKLTAGPRGGEAVQDSTVTFEFELSEEGAGAECALGASAPGAAVPARPCFSPVQLANLTEGRYNFSVTSRDAVGNVGAPVTATFAVDTTPPTVVASAAVTPANAAVVAFAASDGDSGSGVQNVTCRVRPIVLAPGSKAGVDANDPRFAPQPCSSPFTFPGLAEGHWGVQVVAYDNAGQASEPTELDVWVDTTAPVANVTAGPAQTGVNPGGTVTFSLVDATEAAAPGAGSPVQWQGLLRKGGEGGDAAAGDAAAASGASGTDSKVKSAVRNVLRWAGHRTAADSNDGVVLGGGDVGDWANCSAECTYEGLGGGTYTFKARGVDASGNVGPATAPAYVFDLEGASGGLPTWALAAIIAGSIAAGLALLLLLLSCCRKAKPAAAPAGAIPSSGGAYSAYPVAPPPPYLSSGAANGYGGAYANGNGHGYTNGYANGYGPPPTGYGASPSPMRDAAAVPAAPVVPQDPIEAQELALALAASEHTARRQATQASGADEEAQMRAALQASLEEERRRRRGGAVAAAPAPAEDEQLRAAIEASLAEQRRRAEEEAAAAALWAPSAPAPGDNPYASEWPPRR